jgi:hypothetical protein
MHRRWLVVVLLVACHPSAGPRAAGVASTAGTASSRTLGISPPGAPGPAPAAPAASVSRDVHQIIGGSFSVDHLGPDVVAELRARARTSPAAFLDAMDAIVASAPPEVLAEDWPSALLDLTRPLEPERTARSARTAVAAYEAAIARDRSGGSPATDPSREERLEQRATALREYLAQ